MTDSWVRSGFSRRSVKKPLTGPLTVLVCLIQTISLAVLLAILFGGRRCRRRPTRRIDRHPECVFATGSRGNQKQGCQQDRNRQGCGYKDDRCFHRYPIAVHITARCRSRIAKNLEK
jgi:hypothetical protein